MVRLRFRLPGRAEILSDRLARLLPAIDRETRRRWLEQGQVRVDGQTVSRIGHRCRAGARIEIDLGAAGVAGLPQLPTTSSAGWIAWVDAPAAESGSVALEGPAASPRPLEPQRLEFRVLARREGLAGLRLEGPMASAPRVCRALARVAMPVVGDLLHGGLGVAGGARLQAWGTVAATATATANATSAFAAPESPIETRSAALESGWPQEPAWPTPELEEGPLRLRVSEETLRALSKGHPWILADEASESAEAFRAGSRARIESRAGRVAGWAYVENGPRRAARLWARGDLAAREIASIDARVARALARRGALLGGGAGAGTPRDAPTDAFRLLHGEADDLPGLFVDRLGPLLRVLVTGRAVEGFGPEALEALQRQLPTTPDGTPWSVLEILHLDLPRGLRLDGARWRVGGIEALDAAGVARSKGWLRVQERGLRFWVDPGWDAPRRTRPGFGLFLDQRENRARLESAAARGGAWLNLFAHTGAFSVALLAAGAEQVISVDLSAPYLARLQQNLEQNLDRGVDPGRHTAVRIEGRRYLETLDPARFFAGIVVDPPTAATAGRRFWSVERELEPLLALCLGRLESGGHLLVTQNRRGGPLGLDRILERLSARTGRSIAGLEPAPPGPDFPSLDGFPEGDAFEGWLLKLE